MGGRGAVGQLKHFRLGFITCAASAFYAVAGFAAECRADLVQLRGDWGQAQFTVQVADDSAERAQGLMHVAEMPRSVGMLFFYPRAQSVSFWMKNTLIPLDMIFMTPDGRVSRIHENAVPGDLTPISGGEGVQLVLEINGGLARAIGISEGSELRHPLVDQKNALWPC